MEPVASGDHHVAAARAFEAVGLQTQTADGLREEIAGAMDS